MNRHDSLEDYDAVLGAAVDRLRAFAPVEQVVLFGSRARGDHSDESDWDLCVVLADDIPAGVYTPRRMWEAVRGLGLSLHFVPMRRSVFETERFNINALAHDVAQDGVPLFDTASMPHP